MPRSRPNSSRASGLLKIKVRRQANAAIQNIYKKKKNHAIDRIYNNASVFNVLTEDSIFDFWSTFLTTDSPAIRNLLNAPTLAPDSFKSLVSFITVQEVMDVSPPNKSASGPDGVSVGRLRKVPARVLAKLYTLWSRLCWVPQYFLCSKTIFIPKVP